MIELSCKTRGNSSPKGKSRVYFSCFIEDFKYFEEISNEILDKQDCAIYYLTNFNNLNSEDLEDLKLQLSQMQLFVFPITADFLNSNSRSLIFDFNFAKENNIPVLPLMYGDGLAEIFKEKCGRLQYLNKFKVDDTAISYDKKLTDFLNNTLISNELVEKVKSAFDAYVFLSYRKKDRMHANKVMQEIHKNDFARDIAIWFDEFLVPGEDFSEAIQKALEKSELFTLVVTPNLVNENNYVMRVEYPKAKESGKKILPIESVETNKELLKENYKDIAECVNINDKVKLSKALLNNLKNLAIRTNDSPIHDYYIGLAYLYGIDVEANKEKAVEILEKSQANGCVEAMEKLADMYSTGDFVKIDYDKSYDLRKKIVSYYKKQNLDEKNYLKLALSYEQMAKAYKLNYNLQNNYKNRQIVKYLNLALSIYNELLTKDSKYITNVLNINISLLTISDRNEFIKIQNKCDDIFNEYSLDDINFQLLKAVYNKIMGTYYISMFEMEMASNYINTAIEAFLNIKEVNYEANFHLVEIYIKLAELLESSGEYSSAEKCYFNALEYCNNLIKHNNLFYSIKGRVYFLLGNLYYTYSDWYDKSEQNFKESINCFEILAKEKSVHFYMGSMMVYESLFGLYYTTLNNLIEAENCILKRLKIAKELLKYNNVINQRYIKKIEEEIKDFYISTNQEYKISKIIKD